MADKIRKYQVGDKTISIDRTKCISCGLCVELAPKTFDLDKDMISVVKNEGHYDDLKKIGEAIDACAVGAMTEES